MGDIVTVVIVVVVRRHEQFGQHVEGTVPSGHVDRLDLESVHLDGGLDGSCLSVPIRLASVSRDRFRR